MEDKVHADYDRKYMTACRVLSSVAASRSKIVDLVSKCSQNHAG